MGVLRLRREDDQAARRGDGRGREGTATRHLLGWLKDCMEHDRFPELAKKRPTELDKQWEVVLWEAVAMERRRIWQELVPK